MAGERDELMALRRMAELEARAGGGQAQAPAAEPEQPRSFMQNVGDYAGGIQKGLYRIPQSIVKMGAQGLDATGLTESAAPTVQRAFDQANRIGTGPETKFTNTGDVVGQGLATAPLAGVKVAQGAGYLPAIANGMFQGGSAAALTSSASEAPLAQQIGTGVAAGGVLNAGGKFVGDKVGGMFRGKAPAAPTGDELRAGAKAAYAEAENAGVIISKPSWAKAVSDIKTAVIDEGLHPGIHPKAAAALGALEQVDDNLTLEGAERLRRIVGAAGKSIEPDERRLAMVMKDKLDDFISGLDQSQVIGGDPQKATTALASARDQWSRMSKGDLMESLVERASTQAGGQFSGSGFENAMRTQFRQLALNPKRMRGFTADERAAITKVAEGGNIGNAMRWLGKLAPRGVVSAAAGQVLGNAVAGPAGGYAVPAMGELTRMGATGATSKNAAMAAELMRRGGATPVMPPNPRALAIGQALGALPFAPAGAVLATR